MILTAELVQCLIRTRSYKFSFHAEAEREADLVTVSEFEDAFLSRNVEILEKYPQNPRGYSCLALGFTKEGKPIHAVFGTSGAVLVIITVYRPVEELWIDYKERRK